MKNTIIIAIDGYSSTGKSTLAKLLAKKYNYVYVDTGAMYRAVALYGKNKGLVTEDFIDKDSLVSNLEDIHLEF